MGSNLQTPVPPKQCGYVEEKYLLCVSLIVLGFFLKEAYLFKCNKFKGREEEAGFPIFLECFCSGNCARRNSADASRLSHGHSENAEVAGKKRGADQRGGDVLDTPPFGGTGLSFFVLVGRSRHSDGSGTGNK